MTATTLLLVQTDQKIQLMFEVYDRDGDGIVDIVDLVQSTSASGYTQHMLTLRVHVSGQVKFVNSGQSEVLEDTEFAYKILDTLDADGDGSISRFGALRCCQHNASTNTHSPPHEAVVCASQRGV